MKILVIETLTRHKALPLSDTDFNRGRKHLERLAHRMAADRVLGPIERWLVIDQVNDSILIDSRPSAPVAVSEADVPQADVDAQERSAGPEVPQPHYPTVEELIKDYALAMGTKDDSESVKASKKEARAALQQSAFEMGKRAAAVALAKGDVLDFKNVFGSYGMDPVREALASAYEDGYNKALQPNYYNELTEEEQGWMDGRAESKPFLNILDAEIYAIELAKRYPKFPGFWVVDQGVSSRPRYKLMIAIKVGDWVSRAFNGDYYPAGRVIGMSGAGNHISGYRIITIQNRAGNEVKYWRTRVRNGGYSGTWRENSANGTFALCKGIIDRRNPSF